MSRRAWQSSIGAFAPRRAPDRDDAFRRSFFLLAAVLPQQAVIHNI
jgi:hypothetical protein